MSEVSFTQFLCEPEKRGVMESCHKFYTWINDTMLMLLMQILWKISQISNYFNDKPIQAPDAESLHFAPLTKESKLRRHIRSMSDVQSSTPYRIPYRARKGSVNILSYDSDSRTRKITAYNRNKQLESSDSSDYEPRKLRILEQNILKHTDSMRIL